MSIKDRLKMFDPKYKQNTNNPQPPRNPNVQIRPINRINPVQNINNKKLLSKSKYISKENDLSIYQYPIIEFNDLEKFHCENIIVLGTNQLSFIDNLINFCSNISYEDDIRYQSQSLKENSIKPFTVYNIRATKCIKIICFPEFNSKKDIFKEKKTFIALLRIFEQIISKISYVFFVYDDELSELNEYEKMVLFILFNLFKESLKKNLFFYLIQNQMKVVIYIKKKF